MATKYYLIDVAGSIDPELVGPYDTEAEFEAAAKDVRARQEEDDALFWLELRDGEPLIGAFSGGFFMGEDDG